jgi:hypothetical protein
MSNDENGQIYGSNPCRTANVRSYLISPLDMAPAELIVALQRAVRHCIAPATDHTRPVKGLQPEPLKKRRFLLVMTNWG